MNYCIIVARYNEDLKWIKPFVNTIVYNKGTALTEDFTQITLDNVGREGHTYYKHIYDNYENLAEYNIFLQGNPFDHSPNIISNLNNYINNKDLHIDFEFLSERILSCNLIECPYHAGLPLLQTYEKIFDEKMETLEFEFGAGAQFIVSKKTILKRPRNFYLKIIELLDKNISPIEGYVIERFHKLIFC